MSLYIPKPKTNKISKLRSAIGRGRTYLTYVLTFPDGDVWVKQTPLAQDLEWEITRLIKEKKGTHSATEWRYRAIALWKAGETWWKDNMGVEHLMMIEQKKRAEKWGVSKEGLATFSTETNNNGGAEPKLIGV